MCLEIHFGFWVEKKRGKSYFSSQNKFMLVDFIYEIFSEHHQPSRSWPKKIPPLNLSAMKDTKKY